MSTLHAVWCAKCQPNRFWRLVAKWLKFSYFVQDPHPVHKRVCLSRHHLPQPCRFVLFRGFWLISVEVGAFGSMTVFWLKAVGLTNFFNIDNFSSKGDN